VRQRRRACARAAWAQTSSSLKSIHQSRGSRDGWLPRHADLSAASVGDIFVTVTGNRHVIDRDHFASMKDGAIVANSGHFDLELNLVALRELSTNRPTCGPSFRNTRRRTVGESWFWAKAADQSRRRRRAPASVMDMSFANQALSVSIS
jgi:adenosylhomocysteinase